MKLKFCFLLSSLLLCGNSFGANTSISYAINNVKESCGNLSASLLDLKTMAGINTAITGVGTAAGGGALVSGIIKNNLDKKSEEYKQALKQINEMADKIDKQSLVEVKFSEEAITDLRQRLRSIDSDSDYKNLLSNQISETEKKSITAGNVRTGLLATNTATNIAGAVIAGKNQVKGSLKDKIYACIESVNALSEVRQQARIDGSATEADLSKSERIIKECGEWQYIDISQINNKSNFAMTSSIVGAGSGLIGTITSASANNQNVRADDSEKGKQKEKNLNTAANISSGIATGASLSATIFNASQINVIKKAAEIADKCEETLK